MADQQLRKLLFLLIIKQIINRIPVREALKHLDRLFKQNFLHHELQIFIGFGLKFLDNMRANAFPKLPILLNTWVFQSTNLSQLRNHSEVRRRQLESVALELRTKFIS